MCLNGLFGIPIFLFMLVADQVQNAVIGFCILGAAWLFFFASKLVCRALDKNFDENYYNATP